MPLAFALGGSTAATAKKGSGGTRYAGTTSESFSVTLTITGGRVKRFPSLIAYDGKCGSGGGGAAFAVTAKNVPVERGKFKARVTGRAPSSAPALSLRFAIKGTVSGSTVQGTIAETGRKARCSPSDPANPYFETFTAHKR